MSLEAARAAKARELAGKTYAPLMREIDELAAKFKDREFELKFDSAKFDERHGSFVIFVVE